MFFITFEFNWGVMPPGWQHNSFQTLLPSQEELTVIQKQHTTERPLEHGGEAKSPSCTIETKPDCLQGVRGAPKCWPHPTPPSGQHSTRERGLPWASWSSNGKEDPGRTTSPSPQHGGLLCGRPYSDLAPQGLHGNLRGSTTGNLVMNEERRGLQHAPGSPSF